MRGIEAAGRDAVRARAFRGAARSKTLTSLSAAPVCDVRGHRRRRRSKLEQPRLLSERCLNFRDRNNLMRSSTQRIRESRT
jgi:hypothetical protein